MDLFVYKYHIFLLIKQERFPVATMAVSKVTKYSTTLWVTNEKAEPLQ